MNYKSLLEKLTKEVKAIVPDDSPQLERLKELAKIYSGEDKVIPAEELIEKVRAEMGQNRIKTGWTGIDNLLGGFRPKQLIVLSALTKSGKTSFCMDLTDRLKGHQPLWFSFEESVEELIEQYLERGQTPPHFVTPQFIPERTLEWIEGKIIEGIVKYNSQIVFVDHLGYVAKRKTETEAQAIEDTMKELKQMARRWNVVIVLLCHLVKAEMSQQPTLNELKGSSSIAQEADTVILLWRESKKEKGEIIVSNNINVSIQAARRGKPGNVKMVFNNGRFLEEEWNRSEADVEYAKF